MKQTPNKPNGANKQVEQALSQGRVQAPPVPELDAAAKYKVMRLLYRFAASMEEASDLIDMVYWENLFQRADLNTTPEGRAIENHFMNSMKHLHLAKEGAHSIICKPVKGRVAQDAAYLMRESIEDITEEQFQVTSLLTQLNLFDYKLSGRDAIAEMELHHQRLLKACQGLCGIEQELSEVLYRAQLSQASRG